MIKKIIIKTKKQNCTNHDYNIKYYSYFAQHTLCKVRVITKNKHLVQ